LFYVFLRTLEETGYFNASLYTPYAILGIQTLGAEIAVQCRNQVGRAPDRVVVTNAGGGNLTGTARGLKQMGCDAHVAAASVSLQGLHMASDRDFNRKSFTTGHTGFGMPYTTWPDRSDVPRSAARPLRYLDSYHTVTQGEVFYITEALAALEGMERGPAGNTSLAAAFSLAQQLPRDHIVVVQETEYTGAGKHHAAQLSFARQQDIDIRFGNPREEVPGQSIVLPMEPDAIQAQPVEVDQLRRSLIRNARQHSPGPLKKGDVEFLVAETKAERGFVEAALEEDT
ncbi:MAG: PLP-dependent lyase/thiolase, partial [Clostridiales bacterium]|nr:PLP-dependent lyase/thiolase [Clostridiales bacterium]